MRACGRILIVPCSEKGLILCTSALEKRDDLFGADRFTKAYKLDYLNMDFDDGDLKELWETDLDAVSLRDKPILGLSAIENCFHMFCFTHLVEAGYRRRLGLPGVISLHWRRFRRLRVIVALWEISLISVRCYRNCIFFVGGNPNNQIRW